MRTTPTDKIKKDLSKTIPPFLLELLPKKWEKIGDVLLIKLDPSLYPFKTIIGEVYATILECRSVLVDKGGISGKFRQPDIIHIYGDDKTETIHNENGIWFHLDPQKIMFSSGNMKERKRMGSISNPSEIIVDLFAGIGYFSIPMAVYSKPKKIIACEINPIAFSYLTKNISENNVTDIIQPLLGDSKHVAPRNIADRIIMGYFHDTYSFLETAIISLKNQKGIIHYHDIFPDKLIPSKPFQDIQSLCKKFDRVPKINTYQKIKSFAPGISHYVFDIHITKRGN